MWLVFAIFSGITWLGGSSAALLVSLRRHHERRLEL
jgi:hypothetical protein